MLVDQKLAAALLLSLSSAAQGGSSKAVALVRQAVAAQGGENRLRSVRSVEWRAEGYRLMVEQSERPEGPYITEYRTMREEHDYAGHRYFSLTDSRIYPEFKFSAGTVADGTAAMQVAGDNRVAGNADTLAAASDALALSPERMLLTALDAPDLHQVRPVRLQSIPQDVVAFTLGSSRVKLYLNRYTHLPTAIDYSGPGARDGYWRFLGDVTMRTYYSYWWLGEGGVRLPMQWDIYRNGLRDSSYMATSVSWNSPPEERLLEIPADVRAAFARNAAGPPPQIKLQQPSEIAPGVAYLPGSWNVGYVRQDDGVVILEAPISSAYSDKVIERAGQLYPGVRVKAVVTTSDSWPHIGGIRTYVERGIPIYCLDLNLPILGRLARARFSGNPDALELHPRQPRFVAVRGKTRIGSGPNRIELYPIRGETSERQMMAYLPGIRLLYGSDPFQKGPDGTYRTTQSVSELADAVKREGLHPTLFYLMHVEPTDWKDISKAIAEGRPKFPDGTLQ